MKNTPKLLMPLVMCLFIILTILFRNQDANYQLHKLMKKGQIEQVNDFQDSIGFIFEGNLIFVQLYIKKVAYLFLFDTGSPTSFSKNLIQKLNLRKEATLCLNNDKEERTEISLFSESLRINHTVFGEVMVQELAEDLQKNYKIPIDGIIGSNLMQHCIWQIDYKKQKIYLSNRLELLPTLPKRYFTSFTRNTERSPRIYLTINHFPKRPIALVSTGDTNGITLSQSFSSIRSMMLFPPLQEDSHFSYANLLMIGDLKANHIKTNFSNSKQCILGNDFLKHYLVTLDWRKRKIYFENY